MQTLRVGRVADFTDQGRKVVAAGDVEIGVFYLDGQFYAWHNDCPHQGGPVCQGRLFGRVIEPVAEDRTVRTRAYAEGQYNVVCPWHGLEFDVRTGKHPGTDKFGLRRADVQVQDGEVYVIV